MAAGWGGGGGGAGADWSSVVRESERQVDRLNLIGCWMVAD